MTFHSYTTLDDARIHDAVGRAVFLAGTFPATRAAPAARIL
jgi:hypothetical protein